MLEYQRCLLLTVSLNYFLKISLVLGIKTTWTSTASKLKFVIPVVAEGKSCGYLNFGLLYRVIKCSLIFFKVFSLSLGCCKLPETVYSYLIFM